MRWDAPSPTITTQFYGYGNGRFGHPTQDRALSLREGAISKLSTYTNRVQNIVLDITQNTPLILSKSMIGVDGNLNAEKIKKICDKHKIRYRVVDDQLALEKVRKKRNALAHGDESFSRCARDLTISDLGIIKDTVIRFISEIVEGMEKYCNEKQYLRAQ